MKSKYWIPFVLLFIVLTMIVAPGCNRTVTPTTTQYSSSLVPTITSAPSVPAITAADAYTLIQKNGSNPNFVILDVRTAAEFEGGHISSAINIDYYSPDFQSIVSKLDKNKQYVIYCAVGMRGAAATGIMVNLGFSEVQNITGGITRWIQDGYPTVK